MKIDRRKIPAHLQYLSDETLETLIRLFTPNF